MALALLGDAALAQSGSQLPLLVGSGGSGTSFSVPIQTLLFFTALSFLPAVLLMVSAPVLIVVLVVGLVVSLFQAVTQIHEATLAFVPKLISAIAVFAIAGPWMLTMLVEYIRRMIEAIPSVVV